jgi:IclR family transcriptional regulator, acetate operon repressor
MRRTDAVERVVRILDRLGSAPDGLTGSEVARVLGVHRSTASRTLATLAAQGLIERDPATRRYRLGARIVGLAAAAVARLPVVTQARPELEHLAGVTAETASLAILDGVHVVYVDQVTPAQTVVMASWVGRRSPAHASSSGKVLLAFGDEAARGAVLGRRLEAFTDRTITDPAALRRVLDEVRRRGYASSVRELEDGLVTVAAPVLIDGAAVAAVGVSGPARRVPARDVPGLARHVRNAAAAVAHRMSGRTSSRVSG